MLLFEVDNSTSLLREVIRGLLSLYEPTEGSDELAVPTTEQMAELGLSDVRQTDIEAVHLGVVQHEIGASALAVPLAGMLVAGFTAQQSGAPGTESLLESVAGGAQVVLAGSTTSIDSFTERDGAISTTQPVLASWAMGAVSWLVPVVSEAESVQIWETGPSESGVFCSHVPVMDEEDVSEISLDGVRARLLGDISFDRWRDVKTLERLLIASQLLGIGEKTLAMTRDHVQARVQFGHPLGDLPVVRHKLADAFTEFHAAALAVYEALDLWGRLDQKAGPGVDRSSRIAIYVAGRAAETATATASQLHGGSGFMARHPLTRYFRRAKALRLRSGGAKVHLDGLLSLLETSADTPPFIEASTWVA